MRKILLSSCALLLVSACSTDPNRGGYYQDDGPHSQPHINVDAIANAIPRSEPLSKSGNDPYVVFGKEYTPMASTQGYKERGVASWYGKKFHGNNTSSGERYDMYAMTAAHKTLPLPSYVKVENLRNGKYVIVRVNDRGPFLHNRLIDLSYAAAKKLGIVATGTGLVEVSAIAMHDSVLQVEALPESQHTGHKTNNPEIYLQVGAFSQKENAANLRLKLIDADMDKIVIQDQQLENGQIYRVRIGPLKSVEESDQLAERVRQNGIWDAHVIIE
ncbi:MAG: septal ring lytic transglycosylase RlpA family protein [Gammaproteobacteria bacterium]|nr:MAG: septal ring lytic transglycosylase RlpA family protein [Gammaproteobacteria bacterium]